MNYSILLKQLGVNALFWTGIMAIVLTLFQSDYYLLLFFVGLVAFNFAIILIVNKFMPKMLKIQDESANGEIAFSLKPINYPKVLDEEKREYLPEYIHLDIMSSGRKIFAGDLGRNMMKQLRDSLDQVLSIQEVKTATVEKIKTPTVKKQKKKS